MPSLSHAADESFFEDDEESVREYQPLLAETPTIRSPASHSVPSAAHHQAGSQPAETERKESSSSNNSNTGADGEQPSGTKRDEPLRIPPSGAKRGEAFSNPGAAAAPAERGFASGASPGKGDGFATLLVVVVLLLLSLSVGFREYRRIRKASRKTTLKQQLARIENVVAEICRALNMELDGTVNADTDTVNADTDTDTDAPVISYDTLMKRIDEQKSKVNSFLTGDHSASESNLTEQEKGLVRDAVLRDNSEAVDEAARASELRKILLLKSALEAAGQRCEQRRFEQRLMSAPAHARIPILERHADRGLALPPQIGVEQIREEHEKKSIKMVSAHQIAAYERHKGQQRQRDTDKRRRRDTGTMEQEAQGHSDTQRHEENRPRKTRTARRATESTGSRGGATQRHRKAKSTEDRVHRRRKQRRREARS